MGRRKKNRERRRVEWGLVLTPLTAQGEKVSIADCFTVILSKCQGNRLSPPRRVMVERSGWGGKEVSLHGAHRRNFSRKGEGAHARERCCGTTKAWKEGLKSYATTSFPRGGGGRATSNNMRSNKSIPEVNEKGVEILSSSSMREQASHFSLVAATKGKKIQMRTRRGQEKHSRLLGKIKEVMHRGHQNRRKEAMVVFHSCYAL